MLARASEQFRQSDVTTWAIVALVFGGIAVLGANVSALIPQSLLAGLHKSRLDGPTLDQLRTQVADLREQTIQLRRDNSVLAARFALEEQNGNEVRRRVGALEVSLPKIIESIPGTAEIDRTNLTAAIPLGETVVYQAEGGSIMVRQQPLPDARPAAQVPDQPLPELPAGQTAALGAPNGSAYGLAIGPGVAAEQAPAAWADLSLKLGPLLFGMAPLLVEQANGDQMHIVAGPIDELSEATALCSRMERVSIACTPVPFTGTPLTN